MKRTELAVGTHYLCSKSTKWREYPHYSTERVAVLSLDAFRDAYNRWDPKNHTLTLPDGTTLTSTMIDHDPRGFDPKNRVLVQVLNDDGTAEDDADPVLRLVTPSSIRGLYEDCKAEIDAARAARDAARLAKMNAMEARAARADAITARLATLGVAATVYPNERGSATLSLDVLESLLDLAEANRP